MKSYLMILMALLPVLGAAQCDTLMETVPAPNGDGMVTRLKAVYYNKPELVAELLAGGHSGFNIFITSPDKICVREEFSYIFFFQIKKIAGSSEVRYENCRGWYFIPSYGTKELFEGLRQQPVEWFMIADAENKLVLYLNVC